MGIYSKVTVLQNIHFTNKIITDEVNNPSENDIGLDNPTSQQKELFFLSLSAAWGDFYRLISANPDKLDKHTPFHQEHMISYMEFTRDEYLTDKPAFLSNLLRVMYEFNFWIGSPNDYYLSHDVLTQLGQTFNETHKPYVQFTWIRDTLHIALSQWMLGTTAFSEAKTLTINIDTKRDELLQDISQKGGSIFAELEIAKEQSLAVVSNSLSEIKKELSEYKQESNNSLDYIKNTLAEIGALEERMRNLRSEYNFVGLSSGFTKIKEKKEGELKTSQTSYLNLFGCIFIAPALVAIMHFFLPNLYPKDYSAIFLILPFFTIEMILIYFFRLSYLEAKSLRTQLVQIELRLSLCAFIDGYVEYRKRNGASIEKVLDSFDSLIFSPIQMNENNIPAMFDGIEAIAGLADKVIKK